MFTNINWQENYGLLKNAFTAGIVSGSWILAGAEGLGKATLACDFAAFLLSGGRDNDAATMAKIKNKAHPDLLYIDRGLTETEKKDVIKTINAGKKIDDDDLSQRKRNAFITVEDIRKTDDFIHLAAGSESGFKVIIIDTADDMNNNAANALLKTLEEPPKNTVIFLISNKISSLLPTIISRCRIIRFTPLTHEEIVAELLKQCSDLSRESAVLLSYLTKGSIGNALKLAYNNGEEIFSAMLDIFAFYPKLDYSLLTKFVEKYEKNEVSYNIARELYLNWLAKIIRIKASGEIPPELSAKEKDIITIITAYLKIDYLTSLWEKNSRLFKDTDNLYLDKRQTLINALFNLVPLCS